MFNKKKSNTRYKRRRADQQLELQVSSPRILLHQSLKALRGVSKISIVVILILVGIYYAYQGVKKHYMTSEEFALRHFELDTNGFLNKREVLEVAQIDPNGTIFAFDVEEAELQLMARPEVVSANVQRVYPNGVKVTLLERVPVAWVACQNLGIAGRNPLSGVLMDAEGVTFKCQGKLWEVAKNLPVIDINKAEAHELELGRKMLHKDAERALSLLLRINETVAGEWGVKRVEIENFYSIKVTSTDGVTATFGMYEHERQLGDLIAARRHAAEKNKQLEWINLLPKHNVPGKFKSPPAEDAESELTSVND